MVKVNKKTQAVIDSYKAWEINTKQGKSLLGTDQGNLAVNNPTQASWNPPVNPASTITAPDWTVSTPWGTIISTGWASEADPTQPWIESDLQSTTDEAIQWNIDAEANLNKQNIADKKAIDDAETKRTKTATDYYDKADELLKDDEVAKIEQKQIEDAQDRIDRDTALLEAKKESEVEYLQVQQEYQRVQNENAINDAKIEVELLRQQSAWAYNKIWLWFSSWIINQSQQIATNWIAKIAELKVKANMDEATIATKVAEVEFNYASLINKSIDTYTDKINELKKDMKTRINETNQSLLKNAFDKKTDLDDIEEWARTEKSRIEKEHIKEVLEAKEKAVEWERELRAIAIENENIGKIKINDRVTDGSIYWMTDSELSALWKEANVSVSELKSLKNTAIASDVSKVATTMIGADYIIWEADRREINLKVDSLLKGGRTLQEATEVATKDVLKDSPEYIKKLEVGELSAKVEKAKALNAINKYNSTWAYTPSSSSTSYGYEEKGADWKEIVAPWGDVYKYNRITEEVVPLEITVPWKKYTVGMSTNEWDRFTSHTLPSTTIPLKSYKWIGDNTSTDMFWLPIN